jgi:endonuclease/exonuclease/phosphatase family metal-dependent hydrolase
MVGGLHETFRRIRRRLSRREMAARLLGIEGEADGDAPGLVLIQIDGLARRQLERAMGRGRMPFLSRLVRRERYRLGTFYSGLPSTTPAVQAELFYGVRTAVPAFSYRARATGETVDLLDPQAGARIEDFVSHSGGSPLLAGGSAYCDIYRGGATEAHFCVAALTYRAVLQRIRPWLWPGLSLLYLPTAIRVLSRAFIEVVVAFGDAVWGTFHGQRAKSEFEFIHRRVLVGVVSREWMVAGAGIDTARGLPVVHVNFLGYDEMAHRRGPDSEFAHRSLRGIDRAIRRIWRAAHRSRRRDYEVWVYSDHGQERTTPYDVATGRQTGDAIEEVARRLLPPGSPERSRVAVVAIGPVGHVYADRRATAAERTRLAEALVREAAIPAAYAIDDTGDVRFWTTTGYSGRLPDDAAALLGEAHPVPAEIGADLAALCRHPDAGDVVIGGWVAGRPPLSFVGENGAHAGPGSEETAGFTLLPADAPTPPGGTVRPTELRSAAFARLAADSDDRSAVCRELSTDRETVRLVTYNVHGCVGTDGRLSPRRIARVLAACDPDVIALQELDVGRSRSGGRDQAREIARELGMACEFHASLEVAGERYGNAVLSRFPLRVVKAGPLPKRLNRPAEPRGALWVEVVSDGQAFQVLVTHLGLAGDERLRQVEALLGPDWLGSALNRGPLLLCGDLNAGPRSRPYRAVAARLRDAAAKCRPRPTFPSRLPLVRIDHVFATEDIEVLRTEVVRTVLTAAASDHLPLAVELRLRPDPSGR